MLVFERGSLLIGRYNAAFMGASCRRRCRHCMVAICGRTRAPWPSATGLIHFSFVFPCRDKISCGEFYDKNKVSRRLKDILDSIENGADIPSSLAILPPENHAASVTDEESGDENDRDLNHLPGSSLRAEIVELHSRPSKDEEDDLEPTRKSKRGDTRWKNRNIETQLPKTEVTTRLPHGNSTTPVDTLEKVFDRDVITLLVQETNRYAQQENRSLAVTDDEMKCFL